MFKLLFMFIIILFPAAIAFANDVRCGNGYVVYLSTPMPPDNKVTVGLSTNLYYSTDGATKYYTTHKAISFDSNIGKSLITYLMNAMNTGQHISLYPLGYPVTLGSCSDGFGVLIAYIDDN